jgi:hypothetical protein
MIYLPLHLSHLDYILVTFIFSNVAIFIFAEGYSYDIFTTTPQSFRLYTNINTKIDRMFSLKVDQDISYLCRSGQLHYKEFTILTS